MDIIKTTKISVGASFTNDEIARINTDGTVECNWPLIEQVAASWAPYEENASSYFAKVLLSLKSNMSSQCSTLTKELAAEREACKKDVCMYCAGHCPNYKREVEKVVTAAGNYVHCDENGEHPVLCRASGIFAREYFGKKEKP